MALTRITKGVIKPNENYDTHNINSTGIVTAIGLDINGNGDISGNLNVGGVLTYEDVTSIDSVGLITAREGIFLPDNKELKFGNTAASPDLKIYSGGTHSNIVNTNTSGYLSLNTDNFRVQDDDGNDNIIRGFKGGKVELYHNNTKRLETSSVGVSIPQDLDVNGHTNLDNVSIAGVTTMGQTKIFTTGGTTLLLQDSDSINPADRSGIAFVDQNNTQTAFIGKESASDAVLTINNTNTVNPIRLKVNNSTRLEVGNAGVYATGSLSATGTLSAGSTLYIPDEITHSGDADTKIRFPAADNISLETGGSERVRLNNASFIVKNNTNFGVGGYAGALQSGYNGAVFQLHQSQSGSSVGAQIRFTINDLGYSNTDGMFLSYWGNKYFYLQQRETGGGYYFQNTDSNGTLSTALTINSDSNIQIARDLDVDGHTNLDNVSIAGVTTITGSGSSVLFLESSNPIIRLTDTDNNAYSSIGGESGFLYLYTNSSSRDFIFRGSQEVARLTGDGLLGIGTNNPTEDLHISAATPVIRLEDSDTSRQSQIVGIDGNLRFDADNNNAQADTNISFRTDGDEKVRITAGGQVRIANTNLTTSSKADNLIVGTTSGHTGITIFSGAGETGNIYFGDTNTSGVENRMGTITYDHSGNYMRFSTSGNQERLRITSDGKIGIGEDDPDGNYLLIRAASTVGTTKGHIMLTGDSATNGQGPQIVFSESGSGSNFAGAYIGHRREGSNSAGNLVFATRATAGDANTVPTERVRITSDGRIGINDATPNDYELDINKRSTATDAQIRLYNNATGSSNDTVMRYQIAGTTANNYIYFGDGDDTNAGQIRYSHNTDSMQFFANASERFRIGSTGNIGIGTNNPTNKLSVCNGGIKVFGASTPNINFSPTDGNSGNGDISFDGNDLKIISNSSSANVRIGAYSKLTHFVIKANGRIGMGTDNPSNSSLLHLYSTTFDPYLRIGSGTRDCGITLHPNSAFTAMRSDAANRLFVNAGADSIRFSIGGTSDANEKLRILSGGQIRLPVNGQQLTWGASQQMKFFYDSSEERMYLQGDGAYGFAFRVNSGNRIEISKSTGDVTMQGASGRNFLWDNSEASLYLTDSGSGSSARLKVGTGGDLLLYHDVSGNINHITAATNGTIKISGGVEFWDYTGVTKRAVIDSNGLRIGTVSAPTLPTTGKQPMIMRNATYFNKEVHRTISDYRSICDGTHSGYLLLIPAHPGSGTVGARKFYGTIICDRGGTGSGNSTQVATVHAAVAYNDDQFYVENARNSQYIVSPAKVTYDGTEYLALKFGQGGGGPHNGIHIDGQYLGTDSNFLRLVRQNEIDSVQNDNHGAIANHNAQYPICGVMVVDMDGTPLNDNSIRYMRGGTIHFEYSPASTDCYDNGIFTARVNGIYHVTAGVLTGNNVSRVEFSIQRKVSGGSFQNVVNFNGAADFSNSHNGPTATAFIKMKAGWQLRVYRVSSNQGAYGSTHGNNYFGAVLMHGLMDSQV